MSSFILSLSFLFCETDNVLTAFLLVLGALDQLVAKGKNPAPCCLLAGFSIWYSWFDQ